MGEILLYAVLTGLVLGVLYDFLRLIRLTVNSKFFIDFLFWIIAAFAVFSYLIVFNSGAIRTGLIIAVLAAFVFYIFTIGQITLKIEKSFSKKIKNRLKSFKKVLQLLRRVYYNKKELLFKIFRRKKSGEVSGEENEQ